MTTAPAWALAHESVDCKVAELARLEPVGFPNVNGPSGLPADADIDGMDDG